MTDEQTRSAEDAIIASIPDELLEYTRRAIEKFSAAGGCNGSCGSTLIGVHYMSCWVCRDEVDL